MFSEGSGYIPADEARNAKQPRRGVEGGPDGAAQAMTIEHSQAEQPRRPVPTVQPGTQMQSMDADALNAMLGDDDDEAEGGVQGGYPDQGGAAWAQPPSHLPGTDEILRQMAPAGFAQVSLRPLEQGDATNRGGAVGGGARQSAHDHHHDHHPVTPSSRNDGGESVASGSISSKSGGGGGGGVRSRATAGSRALPTSAVRILKEWMLAPENYDHPWPTEDEKAALADKCGISVRQVTVWLTNGRKRVWKPLREAQGLPVTDYKQARSAKKRAELSSIAHGGAQGGSKRARSGEGGGEGARGGAPAAAPSPAPSPAATVSVADREQLVALHSSLAGMLAQLQSAVQRLQSADALKAQQSAQLAEAAMAVLSQTQDSACDGRARQLLALLASGQHYQHHQQHHHHHQR